MKTLSFINMSRFCAFLLVTLGFAIGHSAHAQDNSYQQHNWVVNVAGKADFTDPNPVNSRTVAFNRVGPVWTADNDSGISRLCSGIGAVHSLVFRMPPPNGSAGGHPT